MLTQPQTTSLPAENLSALNLQAPSLRQIDDQELSERLKSLVKQERKITSLILAHLEEVERRQLFAKRGYSSLFAYCTEELGYSASAAQRRISSMRLARQVPEVREKLEAGKLNLTTLAMAGSFFQQEKKQDKAYSTSAKSAILERLENKTSHEVAQSLVRISPNSVVRSEGLRPLSDEYTQVKLSFDQKQMAKFNRLRELGQSRGKLSPAEILDWAMEVALAHVDPMKKAARAAKRQEKFAASELKTQAAESLVKANSRGRRKAIPAAILHQVYLRGQGRCTYRDPQTGKVCVATQSLEIDHIRPWSMGGPDTTENLRLLCRAHNQLRNQKRQEVGLC